MDRLVSKYEELAAEESENGIRASVDAAHVAAFARAAGAGLAPGALAPRAPGPWQRVLLACKCLHLRIMNQLALLHHILFRNITTSPFCIRTLQLYYEVFPP